MKEYIPLIGRLCLAMVFVLMGLQKILIFEDTLTYMKDASIPFPLILLVMVIVVETAGGLAIMIGIRVKIVAFVLALYMVPTTLIFHPIWGDSIQFVDFLKNLAIAGGLLTLSYHGAGPKSIDSVNF
ncbi:MAG: DoxX family protein [Vicingaceae bacterium]